MICWESPVEFEFEVCLREENRMLGSVLSALDFSPWFTVRAKTETLGNTQTKHI